MPLFGVPVEPIRYHGNTRPFSKFPFEQRLGGPEVLELANPVDDGKIVELAPLGIDSVDVMEAVLSLDAV